jgi:hypothetical protein
MREGWTVQIGDYETLEQQKLDHWKSLTVQQRLDEYILLLDFWRGDSARRLERTYRIVTVPPR